MVGCIRKGNFPSWDIAGLHHKDKINKSLKNRKIQQHFAAIYSVLIDYSEIPQVYENLQCFKPGKFGFFLFGLVISIVSDYQKNKLEFGPWT